MSDIPPFVHSDPRFRGRLGGRQVEEGIWEVWDQGETSDGDTVWTVRNTYHIHVMVSGAGRKPIDKGQS